MLRIIGGEQRGRKIELPLAGDVRPPTDRVREAIFNLLRLLVPGRPAFDLFAGSGALGLESLSRGASHATFVESESRVAAVLRRNIQHLRYEHRTTVAVADAFRWTERFKHWPRTPAVVLIAPPYAYFDKCLDQLQTLWTTMVNRMPDDTAIVIQAPQNFRLELVPPGHDWDMRRYGQTQVVIGQTVRPNVTAPAAVESDESVPQSN